MFTILSHDLHSKRRRDLSKILSQSTLQRNGALLDLANNIIFTRLLPIVDKCAATQAPIEMAEINDAAAIDFSTGFIFGRRSGTNLLQDPGLRKVFLTNHYWERSYGFWPQELQFLTKVFTALGIPVIPEDARTASKWLEDWVQATFQDILNRYKNDRIDERSHHFTEASMCGQLLSHVSNTKAHSTIGSSMTDLVAELHDHCVAGYETTGQTLTRAMQYLSSRRDVQTLLQTELRNSSLPVPGKLVSSFTS